MNFWLLALGAVWVGVGVFVLIDRERVLRWSQKHLRRSVGEVGESVAAAGKPDHMTGPGIGAIVIGALVILQGLNIL
ncbi:hypothetical protein [Agromyces marinus]|nr:hypothetical protein [Agromyces marinus]